MNSRTALAIFRRTSLAFVLWTLVVSIWAEHVPAIQYSVVPDPGTRTYQVTMQVGNVDNSPLDLRIPAWCPGWYVSVDYYKNIRRVAAKTYSGVPLRVGSPEPSLWRIQNAGAATVIVTYQVHANEAGFGIFGCHLSERNGFINPVALCMYPVGRTEEPVSIRFELPSGWNIATALEPGTRRGEFIAEDYDELVDSPFELGHFTRVDFQAAGVPMFATFTYRGEMKPDPKKIVSQLQRIAETQIAMFGGAPMKRYFWNIHLDTGSFSGGLEHRASTTINVQNSESVDIRWLASHEFFHLWNVKRIRPKIFGPYDYTKPQRTRSLWFAEGVTSYYGDLTLYRAGMIDRDEWFEVISRQIRILQNSSDRLKYTVEEASLRAWEGGSQGYGNLSYYNKGFLMGLLLDLSIRTRTNGDKSLDDVMRYMLRKYGPPNPGYDEDGILNSINEVTGLDFTPLYTRLARTTEELPYWEVFSAAGLQYGNEPLHADIGLTLVLPGDGAYPLVRSVGENSVASAIGLREGDVIVQVNGRDARGLPNPFLDVRGGMRLEMEVLRRSERLRLTGVVTLHIPSSASLSIGTNLSPLQKRVLDGWLRR